MMQKARWPATRDCSRYLPMVLLCGTLAVFDAEAQATPPSDPLRKPTVAVMEFDNNAMVRRDEFAALSAGVQVMLTNALAANPSVTTVERRKLEPIVDEQNRGASGRVDAETAARIGRIVGAQHMLQGAFVVLPNMDMEMSVRSVNSETSVIEYSETVRGKGDKIFQLIDQLSSKLNAGLKLPGRPDAKAVKDQGLTGPNQLEAAKAYSAAELRRERGDLDGAIAMYKKAMELNSEFGMARTSLATLQRGTPQ